MNHQPYHIILLNKLSRNKVPLVFVNQIDYWIRNNDFESLNNIPNPQIKKFAKLKLDWEKFKSEKIISEDEIRELELMYL